MTFRGPRLLALVAALAGPPAIDTALDGRAWAQSEADKATARGLANEAQTALDAGDYETAAEKFARADALFPAPTLKLGLARAKVGLRKLVSASETYQQILREGASASDPDAFQTAVDDARKEHEALKSRIPKVTILVDGAANPSVTLDGTPLSTAALGVQRVIDPGDHTLQATAPGASPVETTFTIAEGKKETVRLSLVASAAPPAVVPVVPPPGAPPPTAPPPTTPPPDDGGGSALPTIGWITLGVGAAGLAAGGIFGGLAAAKHGDLSEECDGNECPEDEEGNLDDFRTFADVSTVAFIAGGVLAAGGLALVLFTGGDDDVGAAEGPYVAPYVGPTGAGIHGTF